MSRKNKIDPALKVELVEKYLRDEIGIYEAARSLCWLFLRIARDLFPPSIKNT